MIPMNLLPLSRNAHRLGRLLPATLTLAWLSVLPTAAHASLLSGEAMDTAADVVAWAALIIVPVALISAFWLVHILPEKIAEKRRHPQLAAIKILCLLSLVFGGLLWPLAWLWAYTKPVLHKMAYGTDQDEHAHHGEAVTPLHDAETETPREPEPTPSIVQDPLSWQQQLEALNRRVTAMEADAALTKAGASAPRNTPDGDRS